MDEEREGWAHTCTLDLCSGVLSDHPASINVHISSLSYRALHFLKALILSHTEGEHNSGFTYVK